MANKTVQPRQGRLDSRRQVLAAGHRGQSYGADTEGAEAAQAVIGRADGLSTATGVMAAVAILRVLLKHQRARVMRSHLLATLLALPGYRTQLHGERSHTLDGQGQHQQTDQGDSQFAHGQAQITIGGIIHRSLSVSSSNR